MLAKQLENHNKKALRKTIVNLELEFIQFKLIVQMLYDKSTLFVHDTYVIENNPSMANS
jgi:hypothetical protein